jgi:hypothetical protein
MKRLVKFRPHHGTAFTIYGSAREFSSECYRLSYFDGETAHHLLWIPKSRWEPLTGEVDSATQGQIAEVRERNSWLGLRHAQASRWPRWVCSHAILLKMLGRPAGVGQWIQYRRRRIGLCEFGLLVPKA